jgi:hypothetical protein
MTTTELLSGPVTLAGALSRARKALKMYRKHSIPVTRLEMWMSFRCDQAACCVRELTIEISEAIGAEEMPGTVRCPACQTPLTLQKCSY